MSLSDQVDGDRLLKTFLDLVAIDSPTGHEEAIGKELEGRFRALGCTVRRDDSGNLIATYPGDRDETLLLAFHMDTAGTDTGIKPQIRDGVIYSDGTTILGADDKSGLAQVLELLELLNAHKPSHPNLEIVVTVGEEQGLLGSRALDMSQLKAKWGLVYDAAGGVGAVTYWAPTTVYITVTVHGKKVHAGVEPEKGINAMKVAAEAIAAMPLGRIDPETVANIGTIESGEARNIVPGEAHMQGMARSHDQAKLDAQIAVMKKAFEDAAAARRSHCRLRCRRDVPHLQDRPVREALSRSGPGDREPRHRGDPPQERRRNGRQQFQQRGDSLRGDVHWHG